MDEPKALRLAELLDCSVVVSDQQAAAELRRLHAELERCKFVCAATAESWREDSGNLRLHRDALMEALRDIAEFSDERAARERARAAIATVEGEKA